MSVTKSVKCDICGEITDFTKHTISWETQEISGNINESKWKKNSLNICYDCAHNIKWLLNNIQQPQYEGTKKPWHDDGLKCCELKAIRNPNYQAKVMIVPPHTKYVITDEAAHRRIDELEKQIKKLTNRVGKEKKQ